MRGGNKKARAGSDNASREEEPKAGNNPTVVRQAWGEAEHRNPMIQLLHRMKTVRRELSRWSRTTFDDIFEKLKKGEDNATKQEEAYTECDSDQNREAVNLAQAQLKRRVAIEEEFWKQKARTKWDVDGDKNFKYFHACVASRRKKLNLHSIEGEHRARLSE